ncbi:MAG: hypothetical protein RBQ99_01850 [Trichlorobacter sp.]|nr:hypothetical protein [Trichlorobacter sp.]
MKIFQIPEEIADKYHGAGFALGAVKGDVLQEFVYLHDVIDGFDGEQLDEAMKTLSDNGGKFAPVFKRLDALGDIHLGMCSCWEFVALINANGSESL